MALESSGRGKLTKLVADHVLGNVHRDELAAIMYGDGMTDHVRVDRRPAGPGAQHLLVVDLVHDVDLRHEVGVDEGTLFCRTCHAEAPI